MMILAFPCFALPLGSVYPLHIKVNLCARCLWACGRANVPWFLPAPFHFAKTWNHTMNWTWMPQCHMTLLQNIIKFAKKSPTQITNTRREMTVEQFITSLARSLTSCPRVAVSGNGMRMRRGKRRNTASSSSPGLARLSAQQSWKKMFFRFFSIQNHINHIISIISSPFEVRCEIAEESQETCPKPEDSQSEVKVSNLQLQDDGGSSFDVFDLAEMQIKTGHDREVQKTLNLLGLIFFVSPAHPENNCACLWHPAPRSVCFRWFRHHPTEPGTPSSTDAQRHAPHWNGSSTSSQSRPVSSEVGMETARNKCVECNS